LREILQARGIEPDFRFTTRDKETDLDYIHRRTKDEDIYFIRNKNMDWAEVDCVFRVIGKRPEIWMPDTGQIRKQPVYDFVEGGTRVPLRLPPAGSVFVVFGGNAEGNRVVSVLRDGTPVFPLSAGVPEELPEIEVLAGERGGVELVARKGGTYVLETAQGEKIAVEAEPLPVAREIAGPWQVRFPEGWGAPASKMFPHLISWTEDSEDGIKHFSGIATYHKEFDLPPTLFTRDKQILLDLGRVSFVADVHLNGHHLGILWKPPFRMDISETAKPGQNRLQIEVANLWSNRLTGDAHSAQSETFCRTNMKNALTWSSPWKSTPLLESGLLGPVRLFVASRRTIRMPNERLTP
jgi:hypothetical protein